MSLQRELIPTCVVAALVLFRVFVGSDHPLSPNVTVLVTISIIQLVSLLSTIAGLPSTNRTKQKVEIEITRMKGFLTELLGSTKSLANGMLQMLRTDTTSQMVAGCAAFVGLLGLLWAFGLSDCLLKIRLDICLAFVMGGGVRWVAMRRCYLDVRKESGCSLCGDLTCDGGDDCPYKATFWDDHDFECKHERHHQQKSSSSTCRGAHQDHRQEHRQKHPLHQQGDSPNAEAQDQRHLFNVRLYQQLADSKRNQRQVGQREQLDRKLRYETQQVL